MANNPYVNKVVFGSATLVDLTGTTATADKILSGYGAFGADGAWMDGTAIASSGSGVVWQDSQGYVHLSDEGDIPLQTKTVTPSETAQAITPDNGYYALDKVNVGAISSSYVGSDIARRSSSDLTASGATVTVPSGYYSAQASKTVASGSVTAPTSIGGTAATVTTGTNTLTLSKTVSVTPNVTAAGYISSGTAGNSSVSLTASISTRSSSDLTVSGATVTVPSGYYSANASKAVATGTAGTPTATKGTVSNHSVTVRPSVTNTTGYITGGTKTGTGVSVSASELVSGTYNVTSSGTKNVTNYASASVPSGTEGTPTATKGAVSNHSVSVTPSVTNSGGYITGSTKTGTAVTVTASELASGNKAITQNGTGIDVVGYSTVSVDVPSGASNVVIGTFTTTSTSGTDQTVSIPYTGNGYPIMATVEVNGGVDQWISNSLPNKIIGRWMASKHDWNNPMSYNYDLAVVNSWTTMYNGSLSGTNASNQATFGGASVLNPLNPYEVVAFKSATEIIYYSSNDGSNYGLNPSTDYAYVIVYSS